MMQKVVIRALLVVVLLLATAPVVAGATPTTKKGAIDQLILDQLAAGGRANLFVKMASDAPLGAAERISNRNERLNYVHDTLVAHAAATQKAITRYLSGRGVRYESFWINNSLYVYGADLALVRALARRGDVAYLHGDHDLPLVAPVEVKASPDEVAGVEWGIQLINADDVWAAGNTGQGIVVASVDTGVRYTHEALRNQYRGNNGDGSYTHDYNWFDPDKVYGQPTDNNGHGTHTMGTMAGGDAGGPLINDVGVAPGARWIASQGCDTNSCSDFDLIGSAQWIACPTKTDGSNPDCTKAPDIVNNSWGGGGGDPWYQSYVNAWHAAGIIPVFSAGNNGSGCSTMGSPGDYSNVIGVGAVDRNDVLADFSSKGPGRFRPLKPDMVAPGDSVRSSYNSNDSSYAVLSGTSMAAPHMVGTIALYLSAHPGANIIQVYNALRTTTSQALGNPPGPDACGGRNYTVYPNAIYGWGRIDAAAAVLTP
ncbi:MAG: S8 family serine peptidase [Chloroflexi bacterium]|nr:S8 family serine peptidase [Chloroflexota bacterium]